MSKQSQYSIAANAAKHQMVESCYAHDAESLQPPKMGRTLASPESVTLACDLSVSVLAVSSEVANEEDFAKEAKMVQMSLRSSRLPNQKVVCPTFGRNSGVSNFLGRWTRPRVLMLVAAMAMAPVAAEPGSQLVLAYVVNRHGTRNLLPKLASVLKDANSNQQTVFAQPFGEATLLPQGQRECYNAGLSFFDRYLNADKCAALASRASEPSNTCLSPPGSPGALSAAGAMYGGIGKPNVTWNNFNVLATSSALDRSLLSLRSFMTGVFQNKNAPTPSLYLPDGAQPVPLYSSAARDKDDVLIRAYNNCPAIDAALARWYLSDDFLAMAAATAAFRARVAGLPGVSAAARADLEYSDSDAFSLRNWYNVWDQFNTWNRTAGQAGNPMPDAGNMPMLTDAEPAAAVPGTGGLAYVPAAAGRGRTLLAQITWLANWLETGKMGSDVVGPLAGGPVLHDLAARIAAATGAQPAGPAAGAGFSAYAAQATYPRLVVLSGHYSVQLGVLAALRVDRTPGLTREQAAALGWVSRADLGVTGAIPAAAAALVFELHRSAGGDAYAVRAVLQDGPGAAAASPRAYAPLALPCASAAGAALGGEGACALDDFARLAADAVRAAGAPADWCRACRAKAPMPCAAVMASAAAEGAGVGGLMLAAAAALAVWWGAGRA